MNILANTRITTKIISLLAVLGLLTIAVAWGGSGQVSKTDTVYSSLVKNLIATTKLTQVNRRLAVMDGAGFQAIVYDSTSAQAKAAVTAEKEAYETSLPRLAFAEQNLPESAAEIAEFRSGVLTLHQLTEEAAALGASNRNDEARKIMEKAAIVGAAVSKKLTAFNERLIASSQASSGELTKAAASTAWMLITISIIGALVAMAISFLVARAGITRPLDTLRGTMDRLATGDTSVDVAGAERGDEVGEMAKTVLVFRDAARAQEVAAAAKLENEAQQRDVVETVSASLASLSDGDLTGDIHKEFPHNFEDLKTNFNAALLKLRGLIGGVTQSADGIRTGSNEIAQASEDLARRTEGNAASLEETSAALVQIDGRLKATATSSTQTVARADQAIATVGGGRATAEEAVQAMGRVSDSAKGIDSVIEGLDKIAFQTRVLAMNAAVEAGRAGDAGRGFAVVADLVSALAMRAEEEAKRARDQLTLTQTDIVTAVQAVQRVDGALANISSDVGEVHKLLGTMADDAAAQSSAITQISAAIGAMDQSTQQNAAMVEETSAAARNLTTEVTALSDQAGMFTVDAGSSGRRQPVSQIVQPMPSKPKKKASAPYRSPVAALAANGKHSPQVSNGADDWNAF